MDAILFSAKPSWVDVNDGISHLASQSELYWEVLFPINVNQFQFPIYGYSCKRRANEICRND